MSRDSLWF
jgi:hypothetical protein